MSETCQWCGMPMARGQAIFGGPGGGLVRLPSWCPDLWCRQQRHDRIIERALAGTRQAVSQH